MKLVHKKGLLNLLLFYFIFLTVFISVRILLIGSEGATNLFEYLIASLPELFLLSIFGYASLLYFKSKKQISLSILDKFLLLFFVFNVIIGFCLSTNLKISLYGFRMTYLPVAFYMLIRFFKFKKKEINKFIDNLFTLFSVTGLVGILIYFLFFDFMEHMIFKTGSEIMYYFIPRMTSLFWTPVLFGTLMMITFLYYYVKLFEKGQNLITYLCVFISSFCVFFSISRGAIIAMLAAFFLTSFRYKKKSIIFKVLGILIVCFSLLSLAVNPHGYIYSSKNSSNSSGKLSKWMLKSYSETIEMEKGVTRVELWKNDFSDFKDKPLGYGLGNAGHVAHRFYNKETKSASVYSTDGWFLKIISESGVLGLLFYLLFIFVYIFKMWEEFKSNQNYFIGFCIVTVLAVNIQNLVSNVLDFYMFSSLFWLFIGLSENFRTREID